MITNKIHITVQDYQNDRILGILKVLVKLFICPNEQPLGGTGQKFLIFRVTSLLSPLEITLS